MDLYSALSLKTPSKALRYGTRSQAFTCTPRVHPLTEWTIPAFAFPAEAGTHLPTPEGWKAELALDCISTVDQCLSGWQVFRCYWSSGMKHAVPVSLCLVDNSRFRCIRTIAWTQGVHFFLLTESKRFISFCKLIVFVQTTPTSNPSHSSVISAAAGRTSSCRPLHCPSGHAPYTATEIFPHDTQPWQGVSLKSNLFDWGCSA